MWRQSRRRCFAALGVSVVLSNLCWVGWTADTKSSDEPVTIRKTEAGLHFTLPPDWPVETRGGITAPIPIEEYLARKFRALELQLQAIEQRLNGLDLRFRVLEEDVKKQRQSLRSSEQATAAVGEP
jgi:hypothetical protein